MSRTILRLDCINFSKQTLSIQGQLNGIFGEQRGTDIFFSQLLSLTQVILHTFVYW
jgi:hypothetical protein